MSLRSGAFVGSVCNKYHYPVTKMLEPGGTGGKCPPKDLAINKEVETFVRKRSYIMNFNNSSTTKILRAISENRQIRTNQCKLRFSYYDKSMKNRLSH